MSELTGREVRSINRIGVIIVQEGMKTRILVPWNNVMDLTYHVEDIAIGQALNRFWLA